MAGIIQMDFDLRTCDAAFDFVLEFMRMTPDDFTVEYKIDSKNDFETFWNRNFQIIDDVDISELRIIAFHVLGSLDNCDEIKANGLCNLQTVLSSNTIFSRLLKEKGIYFDITNKILHAGSIDYDIDYEHYKNRHFLTGDAEALKNIAHRVYYDYCVNGFLCNDNVYNYSKDIHKRPEFFIDLCRLIPVVQEIESYWKNSAESYRIDFYATIDQVHRFNFDLDEFRDPPYDDWFDLLDDMKIKKWMLSHAIDRAYDQLYSELFLYIKDDCFISPEQILSYSKIEKDK